MKYFRYSISSPSRRGKVRCVHLPASGVFLGTGSISRVKTRLAASGALLRRTCRCHSLDDAVARRDSAWTRSAVAMIGRCFVGSVAEKRCARCASRGQSPPAAAVSISTALRASIHRCARISACRRIIYASVANPQMASLSDIQFVTEGERFLPPVVPPSFPRVAG